MKPIYNIILFTVAFNLAAYFVAYTDFFPGATLYGDIIPTGGNLEDPSNLPTPVEVVESFFTEAILTIPILKWEIEINFIWITVGMFGVLLILGKITNTTPTALAVAMIGTVWLAMLNGSRTLFSNIVQGMHPSVLYIEMIVMVLILLFLMIAIMEYISGQKETA